MPFYTALQPHYRTQSALVIKTTDGFPGIYIYIGGLYIISKFIEGSYFKRICTWLLVVEDKPTELVFMLQQDLVVQEIQCSYVYYKALIYFTSDLYCFGFKNQYMLI